MRTNKNHEMKGLLWVYMVMGSMLCMISANAQDSNTDPDVQIRKTTNRILRVIRSGTVKEFENFIGTALSETGRTAADLQREFLQLRSYLKKYHPSNRFTIRITNEYDSLGRLKVLVPLLKGKDKLQNLSDIRLELLFGPPYQLSLDMIADFHILYASGDPKTVKQQGSAVQRITSF